MGPQPKRCHHCKSADHLIADCPLRRKDSEGTEGKEGAVATAAVPKLVMGEESSTTSTKTSSDSSNNQQSLKSKLSTTETKSEPGGSSD